MNKTLLKFNVSWKRGEQQGFFFAFKAAFFLLFVPYIVFVLAMAGRVDTWRYKQEQVGEKLNIHVEGYCGD